MRILVLCTGNSCRSQMAHGILQSLDSNLEVHSAGTRPAEKVNPKAIEVMKEIDIDISSHTPQNIDRYLNEAWDYVITVCSGQMKVAQRSVVKSRIVCTSVLTTHQMLLDATTL